MGPTLEMQQNTREGSLPRCNKNEYKNGYKITYTLAWMQRDMILFTC